jgi:hypothetical protein
MKHSFFFYHVQNSPPVVPIVIQMAPSRTVQIAFSENDFGRIRSPEPVSSKLLFFFRVSRIKNPKVFLSLLSVLLQFCFIQFSEDFV